MGTNIFFKVFSNPEEGLEVIKNVSFSIAQSLGEETKFEDAPRRIFENDGAAQYFFNGWEYTTLGGIVYGCRKIGKKYIFYLRHPYGEWARSESGLKSASIAAGFMEYSNRSTPSYDQVGCDPDLMQKWVLSEVAKRHFRSVEQVLWASREAILEDNKEVLFLIHASMDLEKIKEVLRRWKALENWKELLEADSMPPELLLPPVEW